MKGWRHIRQDRAMILVLTLDVAFRSQTSFLKVTLNWYVLISINSTLLIVPRTKAPFGPVLWWFSKYWKYILESLKYRFRQPFLHPPSFSSSPSKVAIPFLHFYRGGIQKGDGFLSKFRNLICLVWASFLEKWVRIRNLIT